MKIAFDLGACVGIKTKQYAKEFGLVVAVEPVIENYKKLVNMIIREGFVNVIPVLAAVDKKTKKGKIFIDDDIVGHSLYRKNRFTDNTLQRAVNILSWNDLVEIVGVDHIDFAKVDIEGAEVNLIEKMTKCLPLRIIVEEHERNGLTTKDQIKDVLKSKGYEIWDDEEDSHIINAKL